ncbi:NAD-binding protein [Mycena venus]|uniref:NAD-binding protein n=1 Tax=Mycena venus TaxID=2733690 RepID=A0A8H6X457_9AGAR|nr:NAD-binding protein [Mycena venus]
MSYLHIVSPPSLEQYSSIFWTPHRLSVHPTESGGIIGPSRRLDVKPYSIGHTKLAKILHIKALQARLDAEGVRITCLAPRPGVIFTPGTRRAIEASPLGRFPTRGAMPVAFAAAGPEVIGSEHDKYKGAYMTPMDVIATPSKSAQDPRLWKELYDNMERSCKVTAILVDIHGKVVLVTGGNTGIGYATIQMLARKGAKVYMGARNGVRAAEAIERFKTENIGDGSVHWLELDLFNPRLTSKAAKEFLKMDDRLDILIDNAGMQSDKQPFKLTADGLLDIMVINHISPFVLTEALLPLMKHTAADLGSDVCIVTSYTHADSAPETLATKDSVNLNFGNSIMDKVHTYGHTKLANILHIQALGRIIITQGTRRAMEASPLGRFLARVAALLFFKPPREGVMPVAFAAAGPEVIGPGHNKYKGAYLTPMDVIATPSKSAQDPRLWKELYDTTERIVVNLACDSDMLVLY